jgi:2-hydroxychromene-2-carboxylate isomerase
MGATSPTSTWCSNSRHGRVPTALHSWKRSQGQALKDRLKGECEAALAKGVFGSPYIIVDGEPFFGADRLPQIERWLAAGGF